MTDLVRILPSFPIGSFSNLLTIIENKGLSTADLLALHAVDVAKETRLPVLDVRRLVAAIQASLVDDVVVEELSLGRCHDGEGEEKEKKKKEEEEDDEPKPAVEITTTTALTPSPPPSSRISTLDPTLDTALGGGIPTGSITEITGESGAGKTQFLLGLCLAVQLPPPRGTSRQALYVSTEAGLATQRLSQMLASNACFSRGAGPRPSLDDIHATVTPDLESQEHILEYQVPVLLSRHPIGLLVVDSVAANYRAEFNRRPNGRGADMAARGADLVRLGALLRLLARSHGIAVVVANQVADRFDAAPVAVIASSSASSAAPSSSLPAIAETRRPAPPPALRLDHQQRWFTGWGDDPYALDPAKTPSLGLVWTTQIACRIVLLKRAVCAGVMARDCDEDDEDEDDDRGEAASIQTAWRRWMKIVFAPHVPSSGPGLDGCVEFAITNGGLKAVENVTPVTAASAS
ncbi:DNA repair protein rhp57 [Ophiocordyceps camponoti-floridani]|uniref:DNA repair protein rhp57 n=1 Tax=Ophiocordyceps camponoti-floridani TaxID=2030778 RepID=A0A8H4VB32_9HYPO|nr:DNA repair protein rhp57 [Ophiocordyceps camponoti-floridani]